MMKGTLINNVDQDQTPQNAAPDQGLHCLHCLHRNLTQTPIQLKMGLSKELTYEKSSLGITVLNKYKNSAEGVIAPAGAKVTGATIRT